MKSAKLRESY